MIGYAKASAAGVETATNTTHSTSRNLKLLKVYQTELVADFSRDRKKNENC
jgi:hypothetical protein